MPSVEVPTSDKVLSTYDDRQEFSGHISSAFFTTVVPPCDFKYKKTTTATGFIATVQYIVIYASSHARSEAAKRALVRGGR